MSTRQFRLSITHTFLLFGGFAMQLIDRIDTLLAAESSLALYTAWRTRFTIIFFYCCCPRVRLPRGFGLSTTHTADSLSGVNFAIAHGRCENCCAVGSTAAIKPLVKPTIAA